TGCSRSTSAWSRRRMCLTRVAGATPSTRFPRRTTRTPTPPETTMSTETYYYGQGRIFLAERDATTGVPGAYRWVGDVSAFSIKLAVEKVEHKESYSGQRALVRSFPIGKSATIDMTLHQVDT